MAIFAPAGLFIGWEFLTHFTLHSLIVSEWVLFLFTLGAVALGATAFSLLLFRWIAQLQRQLVIQNRELALRTSALEALHEIGTGLSALQDVNTLKGTAVRRARELLDADTAGLALLIEPSGDIRWELLTGSSGDPSTSLRLAPGEGIAGRAIQAGEPVIIEDMAAEAEDTRAAYPVLARENLRAALAVPVRIAGKTVGALMVGHRTPYSFRLGDLKLLTSVGNQVAVAINNTRMSERLAALSALEERERLAREMHDGLAQLLGHLTARAAALGELLSQGKVAAAGEQLVRLREVARDAYVDVRHSILGLRTRPLGPRGLLQALDEFVQRTSEQEGLPVHLETLDGVGSLELAPAVEVQAIRIIQEALSNVRKHARASAAWVRVGKDDEWITISIQDDGEGFDIGALDGKAPRFGLQMMRERAEGVGGRFTIETAPGEGAEVKVMLPVGAEE